MNAKQQKLYDRVVAEGGRAWVERKMIYPKTRDGKSSWAVRHVGGDEFNAMTSMVEPKAKWEYTPGGFTRQVRFRIVEEEEIKRYRPEDPKVWQEVIERVLVQVIA